MKCIYFLTFLAILPTVIISLEDEEEIIWEIPFETSKVNYHRSKVCITKKGETKCTSKDRVPGNPKTIADMFKRWQKDSVLSNETSNNNDGENRENDENNNSVQGNDKSGDHEDKLDAQIANDQGNDEESAKEDYQHHEEREEHIKMNMKETLPHDDPQHGQYLTLSDLGMKDKIDSMLRSIDFRDLNKKWTDFRRDNHLGARKWLNINYE